MGSFPSLPAPGLENHEPLLAALQGDLVGPNAGPWDAAKDLPAPSCWFFTRFLACEIDRKPRDSEVDDEAGAGDDMDEGPAPATPESNGRQGKVYPASAGLSFLLRPESATDVVDGADGPFSVEVRLPNR